MSLLAYICGAMGGSTAGVGGPPAHVLMINGVPLLINGVYLTIVNA